MATTIKKLTRPTILVTGTKFTYDGQYGQYSNRPVTQYQHNDRFTEELVDQVINNNIVFNKKTTTTNAIVTKRSEYCFYGPVSIKLETNYPIPTHMNDDGTFTGRIGAVKTDEGSITNAHAEILYTLNGKDPIRTKAYIYNSETGIVINKSPVGSVIVLKAKIYCQGKESRISTFRFRILENTDNTLINPADISTFE